MTLIDMHTHMGETPEFHFFDTTLASWLKKMDSLNISHSISAHMDALTGTAYGSVAEKCLRLHKESGGRVKSYFVFNPHMADVCLEIVDRYAGNPAFAGIKIHPTIHRMYADDAGYEAVYVCARRHGLPILTHSWSLSPHNDAQKYSVPTLFEGYAKKYGDVTLILGHSGGRAEGIREAARMAATYPNVYLDTSGDVYPLGFVEYLVNTATADKVMFGSDAMWICPATQIGMILGAKISPGDKEKIFWRNAKGVFGL